MMQKIMTLVFFSLALFGCALTTEQVDYHYQPSMVPVTRVNIETPIILDLPVDARGVPANLIIHKTNENLQEASGGYATAQPLTYYLNEALQSSLNSAGYHLVTSKTPLHLSTKLLNIRYNFDEGLFGPSNTYCVVQVEFALTNSKTGKQLWDDTLTAKGQVGKDGTMVQALNMALNQVANDLAGNASFQNKLQMRNDK